MNTSRRRLTACTSSLASSTPTATPSLIIRSRTVTAISFTKAFWMIGRAVFNGKVFVREGALLTDARQLNKNLLLSAEAHVDTKPELEIFADDVKCAHGAAIGQLDEDELFYLESRGIHSDLARNLLTYGFAEEVIVRIRV